MCTFEGLFIQSVTVTSGVPQGSVLGPLLFLTYINDICSNISSRFKLFADDCVIYRTIENDEDYFKLQLDLDRVSNWCSDWRMELNAKKCKIVRFSRKKQDRESMGYAINNQKLDKTNEIRYLGVIFSTDLLWISGL